MAVNKDNNGVWHYHFTYTDSRGKTHRIHRQSKEWKLKRDAVAAMELHRSKMMRSSTEITYNTLFEIYIENRKERIKKKSIYNIEKLSEKHIAPYFGKTKIINITSKDIVKWQSELMGMGYSNKYLVKIQEQLRTVINFGVRHDYLSSNPFKIELAKDENKFKKEMLYWNQDEFSKFIKVVDDDLYRCLFEMLYWTGLRIGELQALQWSDYNGSIINIKKTFDSVHHIVTSPKTSNSYRHIRLTQRLIEQLNNLRQSYINAYEFSSECFVFGYDKPLAPNTIRKRFNNYIEKAEVKRIRIHDMRHSHVSLLVSLGFDRFEIAKRLGHTPNMVDNTYSHWFEKAQIDMVNKLDVISDEINKNSESCTEIARRKN